MNSEYTSNAPAPHTPGSYPLFEFLLSDFQEPMRRKNLDAPEWIQRQKVSVARDDMRSLSTHCQFEELVVLWITASLYLDPHIHPIRLARQRREKGSNIFLIHIAAESLSAQDFVELGKGGEGNQYSSFSQSPVQCVARLRIGQEQRAD